MSIKINSNNWQDRNTLWMATAHRLNQEIKFLHSKKSRLNEQLYETHLRCAALWPGSWPSIQDIFDKNLQKEMDSYYDGLNKKLNKLQEKQKRTTSQTTHDDNKHTHAPSTLPTYNSQTKNKPSWTSACNTAYRGHPPPPGQPLQWNRTSHQTPRQQDPELLSDVGGQETPTVI
jgi:hypothetical protein